MLPKARRPHLPPWTGSTEGKRMWVPWVSKGSQSLRSPFSAGVVAWPQQPIYSSKVNCRISQKTSILIMIIKQRHRPRVPGTTMWVDEARVWSRGTIPVVPRQDEHWLRYPALVPDSFPSSITFHAVSMTQQAQGWASPTLHHPPSLGGMGLQESMQPAKVHSSFEQMSNSESHSHGHQSCVIRCDVQLLAATVPPFPGKPWSTLRTT